MKRLFTLLIAFSIIINAYSQGISYDEAKKISNNFLIKYGKKVSISKIYPYKQDNTTLFWVANLYPKGYLFVSNSKNLRPVYSYSYQQNFRPGDESWERILPILLKDIQNRMDYCNEKLFQDEWQLMLQDYVFAERSFQQWPPAGSTTTGGWLETNWKQSHPYNLMCPMDLQNGSRSVAGCPSVALAMIMNYHERINNTRLDDSDDYYHSYGSNNQYWIDDDYIPRDFPSFPELNEYLDSLENNYIGQKPLTENQKAALVFACGVAAHQVYTASISGTFGLAQSFDAFKRFSFDSAKMVFDSDTSLYKRIADNIKIAMPSHLALLSTTSGGHNLVVDGYNTDEFYHFNFGWGGGSNGWYTMPPTSIPYNLTIVDGAVIDINLENIGVGITQGRLMDNSILIYPNPAKDFLNITLNSDDSFEYIRMFSLDGRRVIQKGYSKNKQNSVKINTEDLNGYYLLECKTVSGKRIAKRIIIQ